VTDEDGKDLVEASPYPDPFPPEGDVIIRKPKEGWSPEFYEECLAIFRIHRGHLPRSVRLRLSTAQQIMPIGLLPPGWPTSKPNRHHDPDTITLSEDE
jgi:hypothetical protein